MIRFTDFESLQAWNQQLAKLSHEDRAFFLEHARDQVQNFAKVVQKACSTHLKESHTSKINALLRPFCRTLGMYMPAASAASQADPYPSSLVVGGIVGLLQISDNFDAYQSGITDWLSKLGEKAGVLLEYDLCLYQFDSRVQQTLVAIFGDVLDFCQKALHIYVKETGERRSGLWVLARSMVKKFQDEFGQIIKNFELHLEIYKERAMQANTRRIQECLNQLHGLRDQTERQHMHIHDFQLWNHQVNREYFRNLLEGQQRLQDSFTSRTQEKYLLDEVRTRGKERERSREGFLSWIQGIDFVDTKDERRESILDGCGAWLFVHDRYEAWKNKQTSDLLWVTGEPGTGKSVLATIVSDQLKAQHDPQFGDAVIEFFCSANIPERSDYKTFLMHLLHEAATQSKRLNTEIERWYEQEGSLGKRPSLKDLEQRLPDALSNFATVFLIVDGLDEVEERKRESWLRCLSNCLMKVNCVVKIIMFSQYFVLDQGISGWRSNLPIDKGGNRQDIENFVLAKLTDLKPEWEQGVLDVVKATLVDKADGIFLYVHFVVDGLAGDLTNGEIMTKLSTLPTGLRDAYSTYLRRVMGRADDIDRLLICRILLWLANACRPLKRKELMKALSLRVGANSISDPRPTDRHFVKRCGGLIKIQDDDCYDLVHSSLRTYLRDIEQGAPAEMQLYREMQSEAGELLGNLCLTYLLLPEIDRAPLVSHEELKAMEKEHDFLNYSANYWGAHLATAHDLVQNGLLCRFLESDNAFKVSTQVMLAQGHHLPSPAGFTKLHMLAYFGLKKYAEFDPDSKNSVQIVDSSSCTPLDYALDEGQQEMCLWLLESRAISDVDLYSNKYVALHLAVIDDMKPVVDVLLDKGADTNETAGKRRLTPIMVAVGKGQEKTTRKLLKYAADPNMVNSQGMNALLIALDEGYPDLARILLDLTKDVDVQDQDGRTALHLAAASGAMAIVQNLISRDCHLLADKNGRTPLHLAVKYDHTDMVEILLKYGSDLEASDEDGTRPMHVAATKNSLRAAKILVQRGCDRNPSMANGRRVLHIAAKKGHLQFVQYLVEEKTIVNQINDQDGDTPLHLAALKGHSATCTILLEEGAQIDVCNRKRHTALHVAILGKHVETAKLLLTWGFRATTLGVLHYPALHYAAYSGYSDLIRPLLAAEADPEATDQDNYTALAIAAKEGHVHFARDLFLAVEDTSGGRKLKAGPTEASEISPMHLAAEHGHLDMVQLLQKHGENGNTTDDFGNRAIHRASWDGFTLVFDALFTEDVLNLPGYCDRTLLFISTLRGHKDLVVRLLDLGADLEKADKDGYTPLMVAVLKNHEEIALLLLERKADVRIVDADNRSLLHMAAENGNLYLVKHLLDSRCDPNVRSKGCQTAFHSAVSSNDLELVEFFLLILNADPNVSDSVGCQPVHLAAGEGNLAMLARLITAGANIKATDTFGRNAMYYAASTGCYWMVRPLKLFGVNPDPLNTQAYTALCCACQHGNIQFVDALLEIGANVNGAVDSDGQTPLHAAVMACKPKIVKLLLARGAYKLSKDLHGLSPLDYAHLHKIPLEAFGEILTAKTMTTDLSQNIEFWRFLHVNVQGLINSSAIDDTDVVNKRLIHLSNILDSFRTQSLTDRAFLPQLTILYARSVSRSSSESYGINFICDLCWKQVSRSLLWFCETCCNKCLCDRCHSNYEHGSDGPRSAPESFVRLMGLEGSVRQFRLEMMKKFRVYQARTVALMVSSFEPLSDFLAEKREEYERWDKDYNSGRYTPRRMPGRGLIRVLSDAVKFLKKEDLEQRDVDKAAHHHQWAVFQKMFNESFRLYGVDVDEPEFSCHEHNFIKVSLEWSAKLREDRSVFTPDGNLSNEWLESLLSHSPYADLRANKLGNRNPTSETNLGDTLSKEIQKPQAESVPGAPSAEINVKQSNSFGESGVSYMQSHPDCKIWEQKDVFEEPSQIQIETPHVGGGSLCSTIPLQAPQNHSPASSSPVAPEAGSASVDRIQKTHTREFALAEVPKQNKPGRHMTLPTRASSKLVIVRRLSTPMSAGFKKPRKRGVSDAVRGIFTYERQTDGSDAEEGASPEAEGSKQLLTDPQKSRGSVEQVDETVTRHSKSSKGFVLATLRAKGELGVVILEALDLTESFDPDVVDKFILKRLQLDDSDEWDLTLDTEQLPD